MCLCAFNVFPNTNWYVEKHTHKKKRRVEDSNVLWEMFFVYGTCVLATTGRTTMTITTTSTEMINRWADGWTGAHGRHSSALFFVILVDIPPDKPLLKSQNHTNARARTHISTNSYSYFFLLICKMLPYRFVLFIKLIYNKISMLPHTWRYSRT